MVSHSMHIRKSISQSNEKKIEVHSRPKLEELSSGTEDEDSYGDQLNQGCLI